jgi:hypothetical protein
MDDKEIITQSKIIPAEFLGKVINRYDQEVDDDGNPLSSKI